MQIRQRNWSDVYRQCPKHYNEKQKRKKRVMIKALRKKYMTKYTLTALGVCLFGIVAILVKWDDIRWLIERGAYALGFLTLREVIYMLVALGLIMGGIWWFIRGCKGVYLKDIYEYCERSENPHLTMEKLEQFFAMTQEVSGVRITPEYLMAMNGSKVLFTESSKLIWVYQQVTKNRVNYIPVGKDYAIMAADADGNRHEITVKGKKASEAVMEYIEKVLPHVILGYDDKLHYLYAQNRQDMIEAVEERKAKLCGLQEYGGQQV